MKTFLILGILTIMVLSVAESGTYSLLMKKRSVGKCNKKFDNIPDCINLDLLEAKRLVDLVRQNQDDEAIKAYSNLRSTICFKLCREKIDGYMKCCKKIKDCSQLDKFVESVREDHRSINKAVLELRGKTFREFFGSDSKSNKTGQDERAKNEEVEEEEEEEYEEERKENADKGKNEEKEETKEKEEKEEKGHQREKVKEDESVKE